MFLQVLSVCLKSYYSKCWLLVAMVLLCGSIVVEQRVVNLLMCLRMIKIIVLICCAEIMQYGTHTSACL